jgi:hypothetical protein
VSLAVLKPKEILDVTWAPEELGEETESRPREQDLFDEGNPANSRIRSVRRLPIRFYYQFTTDDGKIHQLMIEDWEIGALYWNCYDRSKDQKDKILKVCDKCRSLAQQNDLHFILGTVFRNHAKRAPNPFVIIGLFYPPKAHQYQLFE